MKKKKLIVNIDGPRGIGKSTQIGLLSRKLKEKYKVDYNFGLAHYALVIQRMEDAIEKLNGDTDIVINEGSFYRPIAEDIDSGLSQTEALEKNKKAIQLNETTRHQFQTLNIIMYSEDTKELYARLERYSELTGSTIDVVDTKKEADLLQQMIGFEQSMFTLNANTQVLEVDLKSSILEVNEDLEEIISSFL